MERRRSLDPIGPWVAGIREPPGLQYDRAMSISIQTQWTLVAAGLVAHADRVLAGEECDRLMSLVEREVDGDEYAQWMTAIGDPEKLEALLGDLVPPPAESHREILEEAWLMAVVDGERADEELEVLRRIATRLGVEAEQLDTWREAWTAAQHGYAEVAVATLVWVLGGDGPIGPDAQPVLDQLVHDLPTTHEHRATLTKTDQPAQSAADVEQQLRTLGTPQRRDLGRRLAELMAGADRTDDTETRWKALADTLELSAESASE